MPTWIKASDRLPEKFKEVIVRSMITGKVKVTSNMTHYKGWDINSEWDFQYSNTEWLDESESLEKWISEVEMERVVKASITETVTAFQAFIENDTVIKNKEGQVLPDAYIDLGDNPQSFTDKVYAALEKHGIKVVQSLPQPPQK